MDAQKDRDTVLRLLAHPSLQATLSDPATFFEVLQASCHCLEENDVRDQADRLLGMLIAQQASHFLSTAWPVLFQQLRDTNNVVVKLRIIQQFANICSRIGPAERKNAFHIFSEEADKLFADVQVVTDRSFSANLNTIIKVCARHADRAYCVNLFTTTLTRISAWDRKDALRVCCEVACLFPIYSDTCGTVDDNLHHAKETLATEKYALLIDCTTRALLDYSAELGPTATTARWAATLRAHITPLLHDVLFTEPPLIAAIPPIVASYAHLKELKKRQYASASTEIRGWADSSGEAVENNEEASLAKAVMGLLAQKNVKRLIVPPLLDLLFTIEAPSAPINIGLLWTFAQRDDPLVRSAAINVIAKSTEFLYSRSGDCLLHATDDGRPLRDVFSPAHLYTLLDHYAEERCTYTVNAIVRFIAAILHSSGCGTRACTAQTVADVVAQYFHFHEQLRNNASVQIEMIRFIDAAPVITPTMVHMITHCFCGVEDESVQHAAQKSLLALLFFVPLNQSIFVPLKLSQCAVLENVCMSIDFAHLEKIVLNAEQITNNFCVTLSFLKTQLLALGHNEVARDKTVSRLIENIQFIVAHYSQYFVVPDARVVCIISDIALYLEDYIFGDENFQVDSLAASMRACCVCFNTIFAAEWHPFSHDYFLFQRVFSRTWNILQRCCSYLDPIITPKLHTVRSVFFGFEELSFNMERLIDTAAEVALTNAKKYNGSSLCGLIQSTTELLTLCVRHSAMFPTFTDNLLYLFPMIRSCLQALIAFDPKAVLGVVGALLQVCAESNAQSEADLPETARRLREMYSGIKDIFMGTLDFDLQASVAEAVNSICDATLSSNISNAASFAKFYRSFDSDFSIFEFFKEVALNPQYYSPMYGSSVIEPAFRFVAHVMVHLRGDSDANESLLSVEDIKSIHDLTADFLKEDTAVYTRCQVHFQEIASHVCHVPPSDGARAETLDQAFALLDADGAANFFVAVEALCDVYESSSDERRKQILTAVLERKTLRRSVCAAALDPDFVECARNFVCENERVNAEAYLVDFLQFLSQDGIAIGEFTECKNNAAASTPTPRCETTRTGESQRQFDTWSTDNASGTGELVVQIAALHVPFPYNVAAASDTAFIEAIQQGTMSITEFLQSNISGQFCSAAVITSLYNAHLFDSVDASTVIQLARCIISESCKTCQVISHDAAAKLLESIARISATSTLFRVPLLDYSLLIVTTWLLPVLDKNVDSFVARALSESERNEATHETSCFLCVVRNCLCINSARSNETIPRIVTDRTVEFVTAQFHEGSDGAIVLSLCSLFRTQVQSILLKEYGSSDPLRLLTLLTFLTQTIGVTQVTLREVNAQITPLLLSAFKGDGDQEVQNMNLLFTAVTLLSFSAHTKGTYTARASTLPHAGFSHSLSDYICAPLHRRAPFDALLASSFIESRLFEPTAARYSHGYREKTLNLHMRSLLPPLLLTQLTERYQQDAGPTEDEILLQHSFLHVYTRTVQYVLYHLADLSTFGASMVFSTLNFLLGHGVFSDTFPWSQTAKAELKKTVKEWTSLYTVVEPWLAKGGPSIGDVLRPHTGLFPDSYRDPHFYDAQSLLVATSLIYCEAQQRGRNADGFGSRKEPQRLALTCAAQKMLETDVLTYNLFLLCVPTAPQSAIATPSSEKPLSEGAKSEETPHASLPSILVQRLSRDLITLSRSGPLCLSFCMRSLIRATVSATVSKRPQNEASKERMLWLTKLTEAAFSDALVHSHRTFIAYYGNYVLQCILSVSGPGEAQWETIQILLSDALDRSSADKHGNTHGGHVDKAYWRYGMPALSSLKVRHTLSSAVGQNRWLCLQPRSVGALHAQYEGEWQALAALGSKLMLIARRSGPRQSALIERNSSQGMENAAVVEKIQQYAMAGRFSCCSFLLATQIVLLNRLSGKAIVEFALRHPRCRSFKSRVCLTQAFAHLALCFDVKITKTTSSSSPTSAPSAPSPSDKTKANRDDALRDRLSELVKLTAAQDCTEAQCRWVLCVVTATLVECTESAHPPSGALLKTLVHFTGKESQIGQLCLLRLSQCGDSTYSVAQSVLSDATTSCGSHESPMTRVCRELHL